MILSLGGSEVKYIPLVLVICAFSQPIAAQPAQTVEGANKFFAQIMADNRVAVRALSSAPATKISSEKRSKWLSGWVEEKFNTETVTIPYEAKLKTLPFQNACVWSVSIPAPKLQQRYEKHMYENVFYVYDYENVIPSVEVEVDWGQSQVMRRNYYNYLSDEYDVYPLYGVPNLRSTKHPSIQITGPKGYLQFSGDAEMLDRIEYAAKFLQMSCDKTAVTGF